MILDILSSHNVTASQCAEYAAASDDIGVAVNAALYTTDITVWFVIHWKIVNNRCRLFSEDCNLRPPPILHI